MTPDFKLTARNVAAFTATEYEGMYPPYISINRDESGRIRITARGSANGNDVDGWAEGPVAHLEIACPELRSLAVAILQNTSDEWLRRKLDDLDTAGIEEPAVIGAGNQAAGNDQGGEVSTK